MTALTSCALNTGAAKCTRCKAKKPYNAHAQGSEADRYARYQAARLPALEPDEWTLDSDEVMDVEKTEPVIGWRLWVVGRGRQGVRLLAPFRPDPEFKPAVWQPGANRASTKACWADSCRSSFHPSVFCWCGFRAMTSESALWAFYDDQETRIGPAIAMSQVELWGGVVGPAVGDDWQRTLRASHAQITGPLFLLNIEDQTHAELGEYYGVETGEITTDVDDSPAEESG